MTVPSSTKPLRSSQTANASALFLREDEIRRGMELLYFGYNRLTGSIDKDLNKQGLGRAHHRALYFVARQPDLTVSELLRLLDITKQSLGRVLNELIERGYISSTAGIKDRRQKLLRLTESGVALESELFTAMREKLSVAYASAGQDSVTGFWRVLEGLIPDEDKPMVAELFRKS